MILFFKSSSFKLFICCCLEKFESQRCKRRKKLWIWLSCRRQGWGVQVFLRENLSNNHEVYKNDKFICNFKIYCRLFIDRLISFNKSKIKQKIKCYKKWQWHTYDVWGWRMGEKYPHMGNRKKNLIFKLQPLVIVFQHYFWGKKNVIWRYFFFCVCFFYVCVYYCCYE